MVKKVVAGFVCEQSVNAQTQVNIYIKYSSWHCIRLTWLSSLYFSVRRSFRLSVSSTEQIFEIIDYIELLH